MSFLELQDLTVDFPDGTRGLDSVSLAVEEGEFVALVGPSGSGKTTLLRTIAGFVHPTAGVLRVAGEDLAGLPPEKRRMGMVFQQHAVWPHMSVADNVGYPLKMAGLAAASRRERIHEALTMVGLEGMAKRKPSTLSGGQQQRVALARAVVANPSVLLLDEALSALDEPLRDKLRRDLTALVRTQGLTAVHVTHDRAEALAVADRIVVLAEGRIQQIATAPELLHCPASPAVARFISDATVLDGRVRNSAVECPELGIGWEDFAWAAGQEREAGNAAPPDGGAVEIVVLPRTVGITAPGQKGAVDATLTSVLFETTAYSVTAETGSGHTFRASVGLEHHPKVGDAVGLKISRPMVYPESAADRASGGLNSP